MGRSVESLVNCPDCAIRTLIETVGLQVPDVVFTSRSLTREELVRKLHENVLPLSARLAAASKICAYHDAHISRKQEVVVTWLLSELCRDDKREELWYGLQACLQQMRDLSPVEFGDDVKTSLIKVLEETFSTIAPSEATYLWISSCVYHVLVARPFQYYFQTKQEDYFCLVKVFFKKGRNDLMLKLLGSLMLFYDSLPQKEQFTEVFLKDLLALIVKQCSEHDQLISCVKHIVFQTAKHDKVCGKFDISVLISRVPFDSVFGVLSTCSSTIPEICDVYCVIFRAFISCYENDNCSIMGFFFALCSLLGFEPELKRKKKRLLPRIDFQNIKEFPPECTISDEESLLALKKLLENLCNTNVDTEVKINKVVVADWLEALISSVLKRGIQENTLEVLMCIMQLHPRLIEPNFGIVLDQCLAVEEDNLCVLQSIYPTFLCFVIRVFGRLHRIQKFVSTFLTRTLLCISRDNVHVTASHILPTEFCDEFGKLSPIMVSQCHEILRSLTYHVNKASEEYKHCSSIGHGLLRYVEVVAELSNTILENMCMVYGNVYSTKMWTKCTEAMIVLRESLGELGAALLHREHLAQSMCPYLRLCWTFGEAQVLFLHYASEFEDMGPLKLLDTHADYSATNIAYIHSYLSPEQWSVVAQRITNFGDKACMDRLNALIIQKLRVAVMRAGDAKDISEISGPIMKHVEEHISELFSFLFQSEGSFLFSLLSEEQLKAVARCIIAKWASQEFTKHEWIHNQECGSPLLPLMWAILNQIGQLISNRKRRHSALEKEHGASSIYLAQKALCSLGVTPFLHRDDDALTKTVLGLASSVNKAVELFGSHSTVKSSFNADAKLLENYLMLLKNSGLTFLKEDLKMVLVLTVLVLAMNVKALAAEEMVQYSTVLSLCDELLKDLLHGRNLPNLTAHIHVGQLLVCLDHLGFDQSLILEPLIDICIHHVGALRQLDAIVPILDHDTPRPVWSMEQMETGTQFMWMLSRVKKGRIPRSDLELFHEIEKGLVDGIVSFIEHSDVRRNLELVSQMFEGYTLALLYSLHKRDLDLARIIRDLDVFIQAAVSCPSSSSKQSQNAVKLFLGALIQHRTKLQDFLPADWILQAWAVLSSEQYVTSTTKLLTKLLEITSDKEFTNIVTGLQEETVRCLPGSGLNRLLRLWNCALAATVNPTKGVVRERIVQFVCLDLINESKRNTIDTSVFLLLLEFEVKVVKMLRVGKMFQYFKQLFLMTVAHPKTSTSVRAVTLIFELLTAVVQSWPEIATRDGTIFQDFRRLLRWLISKANVDDNLPESKISEIADCSHQFERLTQVMVKLKDKIAALSQYIICDIMDGFEHHRVYPTVKKHLLNSLNCVFKASTRHELEFVTRALTPGGKAIFEPIYEDYKRYHEFTGRV